MDIKFIAWMANSVKSIAEGQIVWFFEDNQLDL